MSPIPARRYSNLVFRYVCGEFLIVLGACIVSFLTLFLVISLVDNLEDFLKNDAGIIDILRYYLYLQPENIAHILPISLIMATMYFIGHLCRNNELTAFRASGISISQSCLPITFAAILLSLFYLVNAECLIPACRQLSNHLKQNIVDPYNKRMSEGKSYLAFRNKEKNRDWFFGDFDAKGICHEINITQFRNDNSIDWQMYAERGSFTGMKWHFENVIFKRFDDDGYLLTGEPEHHQTYTTSNLNESPQKLSFAFGLKPLQDFTILNIFKILRAEEQKISQRTQAVLKSHLYFNLFSPLSCMIAVFLGIPMAVTQGRSSNMKNFVAAVSIMASYYLLSQFFLVLGKNQLLPAEFAGAAPCLLFLGLGMWKMNRLF